MKRTILELLALMIFSVNIYAGGGLYSGGSGTAADPYKITTDTDLYNVRDNLSSYFILMNDIDLGESDYQSTATGWTPIGPGFFTGNFNGSGHIINNLRINITADNDSTSYGLFAMFKRATVTNLGVTNAYVSAPNNCGILGGSAYKSTIDQCWTTGELHATIVGVTGVLMGGLVMYLEVGTISNCYSKVSVHTDRYGWGIGGLVGMIVLQTNIINCYASGPVSGKGAIGGLVGYDMSSNLSIITNCFWNTETQGVATSAGGTGITSAAMRTASTFTNAGWSNSIWKLDPAVNNGFPHLAFTDAPATPPDVPIAIAASSVAQTSFSANWNAATGATGYYLDVATDNLFTSMLAGFSNKDVANVTTFSVTGLTVGTPYYYRVRAYNTSGTSDNSNTITQTTIPNVPISAAAGSVAVTSFIAKWNVSAGATGYYLDIATDAAFNSMVAGFGNKDVGNFTTYSVTGLSSLTSYYYRVRAYNNGGASASSNTITVGTLPAAPMATAATLVGNTSFTANWNASARVSGYFLDVATDAAFTSMVAGFISKDVLNVTTYSVTGLNAGITYYYRVRAYSNIYETVSTNSNVIATIEGPTIPPVPVATTATSITQSSLDANWDAAAGATGYYLDVATDIGFTSMVPGFSNKNVGNATTYSVTGLTAVTTYYYRVSAYNTEGTSACSNIITVTTTLVSLSAPIATAATFVSNTAFSANWNSVNGINSYKLQVDTSSNFTSPFYDLSAGNNLTYTICDGVQPGITYYYRVASYINDQVSAWSNIIAQTTLPNTPNILASSSITVTSFSLNWNASTGAAGYYLDVATDNAFTSFASGYNNKDVSNATAYTLSGLTAGTTYYCRVRAYNLGGASPNSNISSVVTLPQAPNAPVAVAASLIKQTSFNLNWNTLNGAAGYYLDVATDYTFTSFVSGYNNKDVGNKISISLSGLTENTKYYYRVRGYNSGGISTNSNIISVATLPIAPNTPVAMAATHVTQSSFSLNWSALTGAEGYFIDVATDSTFTSFVSGYNSKEVSNVTTYSVSGLSVNTKYYYRVRAYNSGGVSVSSNAVSVLLAPNTPIAVEATFIAQTSFRLNWIALAGATGYYIDVATDNMFTSFVSGYNNKDAGDVSTYTITGLSAGATYYYRVRAYNTGGVSTNSNVIAVTTLPPALSVPVAVAATLIKQTSFSLNWTAVSGADGYFIDVAIDNAFTAFVSGYNNKNAGNVTTYELNGLSAGTTYYYRVRAYDTGGVSTNSNIISVITLPNAPNIPVAIAASSIMHTAFTMNWNALNGAEGYFIDVATDNSFTSFVLGYNNKDVGNVTTITLSGLTPNTKYYYRVRGYNSSSVSTNSNIISVATLPVPPNAPVAVAATLIKQTSFSLNWNGLAGADGYFIDVATDNAFTAFIPGYNNKDAGNITSYTLSGLTAGTTYYYRVRGYNSGGVSPNSNIISVITLPLAPNTPVAVAATLIKLSSFCLNWIAVSGADGYFIDVATDNAFTAFVSGYNNKDAGNVTTYELSGLTAGTTYYYRVRGYNTGGISTSSNIISAVTLPLAPNTPIATAATLIKQTSFSLNWNALSGAAGYYVDVATDNVFTTFVSGYNNKDAGNVTTLALSGLTANTKYYYRVRGYNSGGVSANSNIISVTTLPLAPSAPVAVAATLIKQTSFTLNWNTLSGADGYYFDVATDNAFTAFISGYNNKDAGNVTTYELSGLTAGTTYYYRVRGYNTGGISTNSNIISAVTLPAAPIAPVAVAASLVKQTSFNLNWNALSGADGYFVDVATDNAFTTFVSGYNNKDAGNVTTLALSGLTPNTKYYYRVRGYNVSGAGVNSNIITVTTLQIVSNAPIARPASSVTQISFVANWNLVTSADGYYIDVATDNAFSSILPAYNNKDVGNVTTTQVTGLTVGTTYYYRLRAYNTGGQSMNSIIISVTTILTMPDQPVATAGTLISANSFTANWNISANATGYYIDVAKDLLFTTYVSGYSLRDVGNVLTIPVTGLTAGTTYYFRVVGYNSSGIGQYSNVISVTLKTTGIDQIAGMPSIYKLNQNYPNPFNPTTKIRFEIPSESFVRVKIYDAVGREVKELANEQKSAGIYEINFVATDLPSGIYIFRLQADSNGKIYSETRKMILMK